MFSAEMFGSAISGWIGPVRAVLAAAVVSAGVVVGPAEPAAVTDLRAETHLVALQLAASSTVLGVAQVDSVAPAGRAEAAGDPLGELAAAVEQAFTAIGRAAAAVAGLVLAPFYYLTFPFSIVLASPFLEPVQCAWGCEAVALPQLFRVLAFPFILPDLLFPQAPANVPATTAAIRQPAAAAVSASAPSGRAIGADTPLDASDAARGTADHRSGATSAARRSPAELAAPTAGSAAAQARTTLPTLPAAGAEPDPAGEAAPHSALPVNAAEKPVGDVSKAAAQSAFRARGVAPEGPGGQRRR